MSLTPFQVNSIHYSRATLLILVSKFLLQQVLLMLERTLQKFGGRYKVMWKV